MHDPDTPHAQGTPAARALMLAAFAVWGFMLIRMDYRDGEIMGSFLHRPLLIFHEAGHVIFRPFGEWITVLGGTLGQLLMPLVMMIALLKTNGDRFGAALALWFFGVSILDVAPYMYDALEPQLMLLSGTTGEEGGHDWIYLFNTTGLLRKAQRIGAFTHTLGALVVIGAVAWGAWELWGRRKENED
jgi:hypothetical protein